MIVIRSLSKKKKDLVNFFSLFLLSIFAVVLLSGVGSAVGTAPSIDPTMIAYYHFNNNSAIGENNTFIVDNSFYSNNLTTVINATFYSSEGILEDGAYYYSLENRSGIRSSRVLNGFNSTLPFTLSGWIKIPSVNVSFSNSYIIVAMGNGYPFTYLGVRNGKSYFRLGNATEDDAISGTNILNNNTWTYIVGVFNGTNMLLYENGVLQTTTIHNTRPDFNKNLSVGALSGSAGQFDTFETKFIDEIIIWNKSINSYEIGTIYSNYLNQISNINTCGTYNQNFTTLNITSNLNSQNNCLNLTGNFIKVIGNNYNIAFGNSTGSSAGVYIPLLSNGNEIYNLSLLSSGNQTLKYGIHDRGINTKVSNNIINITDNDFIYDGYGIYCQNCYSSDYKDNLIYNGAIDDGWGIHLLRSNYVNLTNNTIETYGQTSDGITLIDGNFTIFRENKIKSYYSNSIRIDSNTIHGYNITLGLDNLANDLPINYSFNLNNLIIENIDFTQSIGSLIITSSKNITYNNITFPKYGTYLSHVNDSKITNSTFLINSSALNIAWYSSNNLITNNYFNGTSPIFNFLNFKSVNNTINNNRIYNYGTQLRAIDTKYTGFYLHSADNNKFINNYIETYGDTGLEGGSFGISTTLSNGTLIYNNTINTYGLDAYSIQILHGGHSNISLNNFNSYNANSFFISNHVNFSLINNFFQTGLILNPLLIFPINFTYINNKPNLIINTTSICIGSNQDITNLTTNINLGILPLDTCYILNNFNLTEGVTRQFSPLSISGSSTSKTITSSLTDSITATVVVNVAQCSFSATYEGNGVNEDSCSDNVATFTLTDIPAGESELILSYLDINCSSNTGASIIIILVFSALAIVTLTFIIIMKFKEGEFDVKVLIIVFISIIMGLVLFTQIAQLTGEVCA